MAGFGDGNAGDRAGSAAAALLVQLGMIGMFLWGLGPDVSGAVEAPMRVFEILAPPPPPRPEAPPPPRRETDEPRRRQAPGQEGGSSPANLRSQATPIAAPAPLIPLPPISPMAAATLPAAGSDATSGAAEIRGPGIGSGGDGTGSGSGRGGGGGGGGYGRLRPPRWIRGSLSDADYPARTGEMGVGGRVDVIFRVLTNGRVADCRITQSSGNEALDERTCALIERRYVYEPSRDEFGRPVTARVVETHSWEVEDLPPEDEPPRRRRRW
jgi:protein TonB